MYIDNLMERYPVLKDSSWEIRQGFYLMKKTYEQGGKLLVAGNGGSAADSAHIVGELMKSFKKARPLPETMIQRMKRFDAKRAKHLEECLEMPLPAIDLTTNISLSTAYLNDKDSNSLIAQKLLGYGKSGDVFLGITTSGNSENIIEAAIVAKTIGISVVGLTGADGGELKHIADICVRVPETETYKVQELHLPIYHCWCLSLEDVFF